MATPHPQIRSTALIRPRRLGAALLLGLGGLGMAPMQALASDDATQEGWRFQLTPYVWMSGLEGDVRPFQGAPTAHVSKSFSDLWSSLDAAAFITASARRDSVVLLADLSHARTSDSASLPLGLSARTRLQQTSATLMGGYTLTPGDGSSIDVLAGLRSWKIDATVEVPGLLHNRSTSSFVDPVFAARWRQQLAPRWSTLLYADVGGFGVGSESTWQLQGTLNYQVRHNLNLSAGYRHLDVDYRERGRRLDIGLSGPLLGVTWLFGSARQ